MKFSKTAWIILGVGVIVVVAATLMWLYFQETNEQGLLEEELSQKKNQLATLTSQRDSLENRLTQLQSTLNQELSRIEASQSKFPASVESIEIDELLFNIVDTHNLEIISITSVEAIFTEIDDVVLAVTPFAVTIGGRLIEEPGFATAEAYDTYLEETVDDMVACINSIMQNPNFATTFVDLIRAEIPDPMTDEDVEEAGETIERPSVTIEVSVYSYLSEGE
jgi:hypothetical protein